MPFTALVCLLWTFHTSVDVITALPDFIQGHNVLFTKLSDIHTSGHEWSISFDLDIGAHLTAAKNLTTQIESFLDQFETYNSILVPHDDSIKTEYASLILNEHTMIYNVLLDARRVTDEIRNLTRLCISQCSFHHGKRRSLLPIIGQAFQFLFGLSTERKTELIAKKMKELIGHSNSMMHSIKDTITVLSKVSVAATDNRRNLVELNDVIHHMATSFNSTIDYIDTYVTPFQMIMFRATQMASMRSVFQEALNKLTRDVIDLHGQLSDLLQGHLSPKLLTPAVLRHVLRSIKFRMLPGFSLCFDPDGDLEPYYRIMRTHLLPISDGYRVTAMFPIYDSISSYAVYKISHIPVFLEINGQFINSTAQYVTDSQYIAVSMDSTKIIFMEPDTLSFCVSEELHFCFINTPIFDIPLLHDNCIVSLFFNKDDALTYCKTIIRPQSLQYPVITYVNPNLYTVSSAKPITVTFLCPNESYSEIIQEPVHVLRLPPGCNAKSDAVSILNQIPPNTDFTIPNPHIDIPTLKNIWKPLEIIANFTTFGKFPEKLPELILPHVSIQSLSSALTPLDLKNEGMPTYMILLISGIVILTLLAIAFCSYIYLSSAAGRKLCFYKKASNDIPLEQLDLKSDVDIEDKGADASASTIIASAPPYGLRS